MGCRVTEIHSPQLFSAVDKRENVIHAGVWELKYIRSHSYIFSPLSSDLESSQWPRQRYCELETRNWMENRQCLMFMQNMLWSDHQKQTNIGEKVIKSQLFFSRGHAARQLTVSVGRSVCPSIQNISKIGVFALLLLPNHSQHDCRVSGLVF